MTKWEKMWNFKWFLTRLLIILAVSMFIAGIVFIASGMTHIGIILGVISTYIYVFTAIWCIGLKKDLKYYKDEIKSKNHINKA